MHLDPNKHALVGFNDNIVIHTPNAKYTAPFHFPRLRMFNVYSGHTHSFSEITDGHDVCFRAG